MDQEALIKQVNGQYELGETVKIAIIEFEKNLKALKKAEDELKQNLMEEMEKAGIKSLASDELLITYVLPSTKETFDTARFKKENPELYDDYIKISDTKSSIRITVR